jgi:peptidoglycan/xylan/chitin deacetylase (PgdA/CDA1 family)
MLDVYLTVDTECSMGGAWNSPGVAPVAPDRAILGRAGAHRYGTPLIMDILEAHGLRGVFFAEMFASAVVGDGPLAEAYQEISARGHDVQLHLHPVFHYYAGLEHGRITPGQVPSPIDDIGTQPLDAQIGLIEAGGSIFERLLGKRPTAFRAGNYAASDTTLAALDKLGIRYDSSFNAAYRGTSCLISGPRSINSPWETGSLWEVPVTVFTTGAGRLRGMKPLEISAVSFREIRKVLEQAERLAMGTVTMILHSFSLFKAADAQLSRLRPDRLVIHRLRRLCRFLAEHRARFRVRTFAEAPEPRVDPAGIGVPHLGTLLPAGRRLLQALNRPYRV